MGSAINGSVGKGGKNVAADVALVQQALQRHASWLNAPPPQATGQMDAPTVAAITSFQKNAAVLAKPDGVIDPGGSTLKQITRPNIPHPAHRIFRTTGLGHSGGLSDADYAVAATTLGCDVASIKAVGQVETKGSPWDSLGRPALLFERHVFAALTRNVYNGTHSDISFPSQGGYGMPDAQYGRMGRAAVLDEAAALQSASWGQFQQIGRYYASCGRATIQQFVDDMMESVQKHLAIFVASIQSDRRRLSALKGHNWTAFAVAYNGPNSDGYDTQMEAAFKTLSPPPPAAAAPAPRAAAR